MTSDYVRKYPTRPQINDQVVISNSVLIDYNGARIEDSHFSVFGTEYADPFHRHSYSYATDEATPEYLYFLRGLNEESDEWPMDGYEGRVEQNSTPRDGLIPTESERKRYKLSYPVSESDFGSTIRLNPLRDRLVNKDQYFVPAEQEIEVFDDGSQFTQKNIRTDSSAYHRRCQDPNPREEYSGLLGLRNEEAVDAYFRNIKVLRWLKRMKFALMRKIVITMTVLNGNGYDDINWYCSKIL
jgi:hypothetical protein